jgi:N-acetylglucosamine-6-phosphate deacetylase
MKKSRVRRLYQADYLITPDHIIPNGGVLCENDLIIAVGGMSGFSLNEDLELFQFENAYITPGFIDTHIHGAGGFDCSRAAASRNDLAAMSTILGERGATGFLPTVVSDTPQMMIANLQELVKAMKQPLPGADAIGINIEGPFLNPEKSGAQPCSRLREIDLGFAEELIAAGEGLVKVMTFAPELAGADKLIEMLVSRNVIASMGHSLAGEKETLRAIDAGANHCTHLFNGMNPLHHRDPAVVGAAYDSGATVELICDGLHIHPAVIRMMFQLYGEKLVLISDSLRCAGMPDGEYTLGGQPIEMKNGKATLKGSDTLAGSSISVLHAVQNVVRFGVELEKAVYAATAAPAKVIGMEEKIGSIAVGKYADFLILDENLNLEAVYIGGKRYK